MGQSAACFRSFDARLFLITDVDPAVVWCLLLVTVLLCGRRLSGDMEIGWTQVYSEGIGRLFCQVLLCEEGSGAPLRAPECSSVW